MDLIHCSFAPLILFRVLYTFDFLPYYLLIANGAGGVGIFEFLILHSYFNVLYKSYQVNNKVINVLHYNVLLHWNFVCGITQRVAFVHKFICKKPAVMITNDQRLTNLYGSVVFHIQHRLVWFSGSLKPQVGSFNR